MKAIEFPEVNLHVGENQPQYETLPVHTEVDDVSRGYFIKVTACFELDEEELKQVTSTGQIWYTLLVPRGDFLNPIKMSTLKPEMK